MLKVTEVPLYLGAALMDVERRFPQGRNGEGGTALI
jgi:hypothetical protein